MHSPSRSSQTVSPGARMRMIVAVVFLPPQNSSIMTRLAELSIVRVGNE